MYEDKTAAGLHEELLGQIDDSYQKTVGYPTYDLTKAFALVMAPLYLALADTAAKLDVDQLSGDDLTRFTKQRKGVKRKEATYATGLLDVTGSGQVKAGDLFETAGGIQFRADATTDIVSSAHIAVTSTIAGAAGNVGAGAITMMPKTIQGITACSNPAPTSGGYASETDDSLRARYYEALQRPPTSGNKYHYIAWAKEVSGVGDAKVYPLWAGDNTVQIVIIDDNKQPADNKLIASVQQHIDPDSAGTGDGEAPIGAHCTVTSAIAKSIAVTVTVKLLAGYDAEVVRKNITDAITEYLQSIAFKQDYVSYGKIAGAINDSIGVEDYSGLTVNNGNANIAVADKEVAILGGVTIHVE